MKNYWIIFGIVLTTLSISSCIEDDIVDDIIPARIRLTNPIETLTIGETYQLEVNYFDISGTLDNSVQVNWTSSASDIISVNDLGVIEALEIGSATIEATVDGPNEVATMSIDITTLAAAPIDIDTMMTSEPMDTMTASEPMDTTITETAKKFREGSIQTTTFYDLQGTFELIEEDDEKLTLSIHDDFFATSSLPGLYVYLSNNPNSIGNALEVGKVTTFRGAHTFTIENVGLTDYNYLVYFCKPFVVKVGDAEMGDPN